MKQETHTQHADTEICTVAVKGLFTKKTGPKSRTQAIKHQVLLCNKGICATKWRHMEGVDVKFF